MPRYRLPQTTEEIFFRQGRRRALEALLTDEGIESIGTLLGKTPFRAVSLLVQYGVDRGINGAPVHEAIWPPAISIGEADALIDTVLDGGTSITDLGGELIAQYMGTPPKKDDGGAASGPAPTTI